MNICPKCRALSKQSAFKTCVVCDHKFDGTEAGYPQLVERVSFASKKPTQKQIDVIMDNDYNSQFTGDERKKGLNKIVSGIIFGPLMFGLALLIRIAMRDMNETFPLGILFLVCLVGGPILLVYSVYTGIKMMSSARKEKPIEEVFETFVGNLLDSSGKPNKKNSDIFLSPSESISASQYEKYNNSIVENIFKYLEERGGKPYESCLDACLDFSKKPFKAEWTNKMWKGKTESFSADEISENCYNVKAKIKYTFQAYCKPLFDFLFLDLTSVEVTFDLYYILNGDRWYMTDVMPEITIEHL